MNFKSKLTTAAAAVVLAAGVFLVITFTLQSTPYNAAGELVDIAILG